jgi:hypothetical protein
MPFLFGPHKNIKLGFYCNYNQVIIIAYVRFEVLVEADVKIIVLKGTLEDGGSRSLKNDI